jgi:hypothetical protein
MILRWDPTTLKEILAPPIMSDTGRIARQHRIRRKTDLFFPFLDIDDKTAFSFSLSTQADHASPTRLNMIRFCP